MDNKSELEKKLDLFNDLDNDKKLFNYIRFENYNEERIALSKLIQKCLIGENIPLYYSYMNYENVFSVVKYYNKTIFDIDLKLKIWLKLSSNVMSNVSIGFPIVYKTLDSCENYRYIFFEKIRAPKIILKWHDLTINKKLIKEIMFQKLFILYHLYINNYYSDCFTFNVHLIPKCKINFKIKDMIFEMEITHLIVLSEKTDLLLAQNIDQDVFINKIIEYDDYNFINKSNFIECFYYNFKDYLSTNYILGRLPSLIDEQKLETYNPGDCACLKTKDIFTSVIILNEFDDSCEVLQFINNATILSTINKNMLYKKPIIHYNRNIRNVENYIIGEI